MNSPESFPAAPPPTGSSRLPHVVLVLAGIAVVAGLVLLWIGQTPHDVPQENRALGSTLNLGTGGRVPLADMPDLTAGDEKEPGAGDAATQPEAPVEAPQPVTTPDVSPAEEKLAARKQALLGTWKQYSHGHRLLKVTDDGKATIDVKLDGIPALAFGEKFRMEIEWTIEGETLVFKTTGGKPESSVNAVTTVYGDKRVYTILDINDKQMLLQEGDEKKTPWDRVTEEETPADATAKPDPE